jgi:glycolate oxidase
MTKYGKVTKKIVKELQQIAGERSVIYNDHDQLEPYGKDEAGALYAAMPEAVVKPNTAEQVSKILELANREKIPVTPRGAGSGLAGGAIPLHGGIVLSLEKMNRVLEVDTTNFVAVVEPGVVTNDLCKLVAEKGLFYAGYPMSVESSFVGGNVACNAGGAKVIRYGATAAHVLGLEVVLPSGEIVEMGGKRRKDSSGYSLLRFFIGSEGTLGVFTKIYLNLVPEPGRVADLLVPFRTVEEAIHAVPKTMMASKELPVAVEFIDQLSVAHCSTYTNSTLPYQDEAGAYLILQLEGRTKEDLQDVYELAGNACLESGALEVFVADNKFASEKIWNMRRNWLEALKVADPYVSTGDFVVPISEIPHMMDKINELSKEYDVEIPCAGHAADGNIHPAPLKPARISPERWKNVAEEILERIAIEAAKRGGAVSGEHGIGFVKKGMLSKTKADEIEVMRRIKEVLDPNFILNPGKLF